MDCFLSYFSVHDRRCQVLLQQATIRLVSLSPGYFSSHYLTDGSITYKLGDAGHLSTAEKAVNGPMAGAVDAEARVDSFNGFSVGLGVGPGTLTVALDQNSR